MQKTAKLQASIGDSISLVDTPALLVDLDIVDQNIKRMFENFSGKRINIRPHTKTVKSPELARKYLDAGAGGVCVAKLGEAEVMAAAGIEDILITTPIIGDTKLARLFALLKEHSEIKVVVDSRAGVDALVRASGTHSYSKQIDVLIEINVGQNRAGVEHGEPALALARYVQEQKQLNLIGVQGYEGHVQLIHDAAARQAGNSESMNKLKESVLLMREAGIAVPVVTTGGSGSSPFCALCDVVTEVQPGSFVFGDTTYRPVLGNSYGLALTLVSTVISERSARRLIIDAGFKSLSTDCGNAEPKNMPGVKYEPAGDEHGVLISDQDMQLKIGDRVELYPSHIDTTVNLHDTFYCHRNGRLEGIIAISARGKVM